MALNGIANGYNNSSVSPLGSSPEISNAESVAAKALNKRLSREDSLSGNPLKQRAITPTASPAGSPRTPNTVERAPRDPVDPFILLNQARSTPKHTINVALLEAAREQGILDRAEFEQYHAVIQKDFHQRSDEDRSFIHQSNKRIFDQLRLDGIGGRVPLLPRGLFHEVGAATLSSSGLWDN